LLVGLYNCLLCEAVDKLYIYIYLVSHPLLSGRGW
jgi:hypothetical protein